MFQLMPDPPLPVPAPNSVDAVLREGEQLERPERLQVAVCQAHGADAPVVGSTAPTPMIEDAVQVVEEPAEDDPGRRPG